MPGCLRGGIPRNAFAHSLIAWGVLGTPWCYFLGYFKLSLISTGRTFAAIAASASRGLINFAMSSAVACRCHRGA
jgi:hypothetical protein